ncbi:MAG TPA: outer membrane protein assembly factor BamA, partial [Sphaerochaeta sp.]|nr:outer membrane protein assembly factor BamA [Sphaerochaeta sp.]
TLATLGAADDQAWYVGKKIASFTNIGLQNVDKNKVADVQYPFVGKTFSDDLFNELQGKLYAMDNFLYFLAEAQRGGADNNELVIELSFFELPYIGNVVLVGNDNIKEKDLLEVITAKSGTFLQEQAIDLSKEAIRSLYLKKGYASVSVEGDYSINEESNRASITYTITENAQKRIGELVFEGNEAFSSELLKKQLESKAITYFNAGYYNPSTIETDKDKLLSYYGSNGYIEAKITEVRTEDISVEGDKFSRLRITYVIDEGLQWFFGGITVEGNTIFNDEQFQSLISMKKGSVLDQNRVQAQIANVADLYWNNGYIFNLMSTEEIRDEENQSISFVLKVQENQQAVIEDIRLEGTTKTKDYVFLRELTFKKGDIFSKEQLIKSAQNIYNTLIVTDVQFDILNGSTEGTVIPVFTVTEGNQMDIQFGATFGGNVDGFPVSGFLQWSDKNLAGTGRDLSISTTLSPDTQNVSVSFSDGWVGNKRWSNGLSLSFERSIKDSTLQRGLGSDYYGLQTTDSAYPLGYGSYASYQASGEAIPASINLMTYVYQRFAIGYNTGYTFMFRPGSLILSGGLSIGLNHATYDRDIYDPFEELIKKYADSWQFSNRISLGLTWDGRDLIENTSKGYLF